MDRRKFLKIFGGGAMTTAAVLTGCKSKTETQAVEEYKQQVEPPVGKMTYRINPTTKDKVSLLGYGMMRLPSKTENQDDYDQEMINRQVDYAIEHGVNYTNALSTMWPPSCRTSTRPPRAARPASRCTRTL